MIRKRISRYLNVFTFLRVIINMITSKNDVKNVEKTVYSKRA